MPDRDPRVYVGILPSGARILLLPGWVLAIAIMLHGYADVGDGFSAGVIATLTMLLQGLAFGADELDRMAISRYAPYMAFVGLFLALLVAFAPLLFGQNLFTHWPGIDHHVTHIGILEIMTPVVFDIGVFLMVYGFGVGAMHAVAREEVRHARARGRTRRPGSTEVERSLVDEPEEDAR